VLAILQSLVDTTQKTLEASHTLWIDNDQRRLVRRIGGVVVLIEEGRELQGLAYDGTHFKDKRRRYGLTTRAV
jgi:hypothetical protein